MKPRDVAMLFLLGAIWGASFLFIRMAVPIFGPTALVTYRVFLAAIALMLYASVSGQKLTLRAYAWQFLVLGALNAAVPFTLISFAELYLPASLASILNSITPLFTAVLSVFFLSDPLTPKKIAGLLLGIVGVGLVVGWSPFEMNNNTLISVVAMLVASLFYGIGTVFAKRTFKGLPALTMAVGQQLGAGIVLLPLAVINFPTTMTVEAFVPATILALLCTAFAYLLYFTLVKNVGATNTTSVTMIVPFFGILWGAMFLGEQLQVGQIVGFGVILVALTLVTGVQLRKSKEKIVASA
jgi:drug/metabolite transporter (DMT)-like permease